MMLTVEEAKTKWCPFARVRANDGGSVNRYPGAPLNTWPHCIADSCMAWEWRTNPGPENTKGKQPRGVCGLAVYFISTSSLT
jgi:hypothetical protein